MSDNQSENSYDWDQSTASQAFVTQLDGILNHPVIKELYNHYIPFFVSKQAVELVSDNWGDRLAKLVLWEGTLFLHDVDYECPTSEGMAIGNFEDLTEEMWHRFGKSTSICKESGIGFSKTKVGSSLKLSPSESSPDSGKTVRIVYNGDGQGDWVNVFVNNDIVFANHRLEPYDVFHLLNGPAKGYTSVEYQCVNDDGVF